MIQKYFRELGEFIFQFAVCESYINQFIILTNDPLNLNKGYKTVSDKIYSLDKRINVLRHQIRIDNSIEDKKQILDILDKIEVDKEFRNDVVHGIIGTQIPSNELIVIPLRDIDTGKPVKSTIVSDGTLKEYIKKIKGYNTELHLILQKLKLRNNRIIQSI